MKPRNKFQKQIVELSKTIPSISKTQINWATKTAFKRIARVTKQGKASCLECGGEWSDKSIVTAESCKCPHCGADLTINQTRQRNFSEYDYVAIITTHKGHQVLRFLYVTRSLKVGRKARYTSNEVVQRWIAPSGKFTTLALLRTLFWWQDSWQWNSDLELRPEKALYDIKPSYIYPRMRVTSEIKRRGFSGDFHGMSPLVMFHALLSSNRAETLLKAKQMNLLRHFAYRHMDKIENYCGSIRIAIRNRYTIQDGSMWCDYIDLLSHFGKDLLSPKYVCPTDLKAEHDRLIERKQRERRLAEKAEKIARAAESEELFRELKSKFFGLSFSDGALQIRVLESVAEYVEEGDTMHHCIYEREYFSDESSLIFSATIDGERVATIEVSLETLKILQCRGKFNSHVDQEPQITTLISQNIDQIERRLTA